MKIRLIVFAVLLFVLCAGVALAPAPSGIGAIVIADGSDPMPLCRPSQGHPCRPPALIADGGPIPLCPPKDKECIKKNWPPR